MENTGANLARLKGILREDEMPLLSETELAYLLESSDSLDEAVYRGAIMKSENTTLQISGMSTADTSNYFLRIAAMYRPNNSGTLGGI